METVKICCLDTVYSLLIYLLQNGYNTEDIFIFSSGIPKPIRDNIPHIYFPNIKFYEGMKFAPLNSPSGIIKNIKGYLSYAFGILKLRILLFFKTFNKNVEIYGHGHITFSFPLYEYENSYIIEDGIGNYYDLKTTPKKNKLLEKILHFCGVYIFNIKEGFGTHENIKKIYLTNKEYPEVIKEKVELIDLNTLWKNQSEDEKNKILDLFNLHDLKNNLNNNTTILLTQPFCEENLLPFDEEIAIYKSIIEKNKNIIIKTHPRENKNYRKLFPHIKVIGTPFPVELLKFMDFKVKKVITICSTAILNFEDESEIEIYNGETSNKEINRAIEVLKTQI